MRKFLAIGAAGAAVGYGAVYLALGSKPAPAPEQAPESAVVAGPQAPVVLEHVVEVTDIDPLLDPQPSQLAGIPFDSTEPGVPINLQLPAAPIPPSAD